MVLDSLDARSGAIAAFRFPWDWDLALEVAAAISGAIGAALFLRDSKTHELRVLASTLPDERRWPTARAIARIEAEPRGSGAAGPVADGWASSIERAWWRVPIRDGRELLGALYLEFTGAGDLGQATQDALAQWARIAAAQALRSTLRPPARLAAMPTAEGR